jgi:hypothetical protein
VRVSHASPYHGDSHSHRVRVRVRVRVIGLGLGGAPAGDARAAVRAARGVGAVEQPLARRARRGPRDGDEDGLGQRVDLKLRPARTRLELDGEDARLQRAQLAQPPAPA